MDSPNGPHIATVIPVLNEVHHIESCLNGLLNQTIASNSHIILVMDGGSIDGTQDIIKGIISRTEASDSPRLELHDNPGMTVAHARNLALKLLPESVEFIIELIGHSTVEPNHIEKRIEAWKLSEQEAGQQLAGVGCKVVSRQGKLKGAEQWIEGCLASPIGHSDGQFSQFTETGPSKIPAFVMHRRSSVEAVGGWDENFITSQDSELSMRLLDAGHVLYRHPEPTVSMVKRTKLRQWWRMGHRYGFWRTKVLMKHPKRVSISEFLPLFGLLLLALLYALDQPMWWIPIPVYATALIIEGVRHCFRSRDFTSLFGVPLCLIMLHTSFTLGLTDGLIRKGRSPKDRK